MAKIKAKELDQILKILPPKEQEKIREADLNLEYVNEELAKAQKAMKMDTSFGIPWLIAYCLGLWQFGYTVQTLAIFGIGMIYFLWAIYTRGTYGTNSRKAKVFKALKAALENKGTR